MGSSHHGQNADMTSHQEGEVHAARRSRREEYRRASRSGSLLSDQPGAGLSVLILMSGDGAEAQLASASPHTCPLWAKQRVLAAQPAERPTLICADNVLLEGKFDMARHAKEPPPRVLKSSR